MRRQIPLFIVLILGIFFFIQFFVPSKLSTKIYQTALQWEIIIGAFAIVLAIGSLVNHHLIKIKRRREHWQYSYATLIGLVAMASFGILGRFKGLQFFS